MSPALYGPASARTPSHSYFLAKLVSLDFCCYFFFRVAPFFQNVRIASVRGFVAARQTDDVWLWNSWWYYDFVWISHLLSFVPPLFCMPQNKAGFRLTRPFVTSFKLVSNRWVSRTIIWCNLAAWRDYSDFIILHLYYRIFISTDVFLFLTP